MEQLIEFQKNYEAFRIWTVFGFVGGLIGIGLSIYGFLKRSRLKIVGILLIVHMFLCAEILSLVNNIFSKRAKEELLRILNDPKLSLTVCDQPIQMDSQASFISEIKSLSEIPRHHSRPLDTLPIKILKDKTDIKIRIQRDSDRENEYWIYWDKYNITTDNAIGYLQTSKFDNINCR